eukprot:CAMPEP_0180245840 /NCGR_PEP_ID=MMETSP0987-20121128/35226_1 /TAXON_ID=697907 /ORGANISM="non described non described, Strain CCMP2293" /LENGTH=43 /DNA_ID= /DNA_START= /DNA_END= /DNA_ORIENTATION=
MVDGASSQSESAIVISVVVPETLRVLTASSAPGVLRFPACEGG